MPVNLQVQITVKSAVVGANNTITVTDPPRYDSKSLITADTSSSISITVPAKNKCWEVYVEAGQREWLKFFAISPTHEEGQEEVPFPKGFYFVCGDNDKKNSTKFDLGAGPVAYWGDALDPLFEGLGELEKIIFNNPTACGINVTIYFVRNVAQPQEPDTCQAN